MTPYLMQVLAQATPTAPGDPWQWWATLGVGGVLAGFMFLISRKDTKEHAETIKEMKEQHADAIREMKEQADQDRRELRATLQENTKVIAQNTEVQRGVVDMQRAVVDALNRIAPDGGRDATPRPNHWKGR